MTTKRGLVTGFIQVTRPRFLSKEHIYENIRGEEYYKDVSGSYRPGFSRCRPLNQEKFMRSSEKMETGKSTLIKCLTGVYEPEEGEVMIGGENAMKNKALFDKVAYVPQEIDLFGICLLQRTYLFRMEKIRCQRNCKPKGT